MNQKIFMISNDLSGEMSGTFAEKNNEEAKASFTKLINGGHIAMTEQRSHFHLLEMGTWSPKLGTVINDKPKLVCCGVDIPIQ